jgi:hypothetical protein
MEWLKDQAVEIHSAVQHSAIADKQLPKSFFNRRYRSPAGTHL